MSPDDDAAETVVFSFRLDADASTGICVTAEDADIILYTADKTHLQEKAPADLLDVFRAHCNADDAQCTADIMLSKRQFDAALRELIPLPQEPDREMLSQLLGHIFFAYDRSGADAEEQDEEGGEEGGGAGRESVAGLAEVLSGLSLLCGGSKSDKLAFAFDLFDSSGEGLLTMSQVAAYLGSFMTAICALTSQGASMSPQELASVVDGAAASAALSLFRSKDDASAAAGGGGDASDNGYRITFEDLGAWYNDDGFEVIPWLELLSLSKWRSSLSLKLQQQQQLLALDLQQQGEEEHGEGVHGGSEEQRMEGDAPLQKQEEDDEEEEEEEASPPPPKVRAEALPPPLRSPDRARNGGGGGGGVRIGNGSVPGTPPSPKPRPVARTAPATPPAVPPPAATAAAAAAAALKHSPPRDNGAAVKRRPASARVAERGVGSAAAANGVGRHSAPPPPSVPHREVEGVAEGDGAAAVRSDVAFCFVLGPDMQLELTDGDVMVVLSLAYRTGLALRDPREVGALFMAAAGAAPLPKTAFDAVIRELIPATTLLPHEREAFSVVLSAIFFSFDREGSSSVDAAELAVGFSVLCRGNKSVKLEYAFEVLGEGHAGAGGRLNRRGLWRVMRSILSCLMGLCTAAAELTAEQLAQAIDAAAVWASARIFDGCSAQQGEPIAAISWDALAQWYSGGGWMAFPVLELLDLAKWSRRLGQYASKAAAPAGAQASFVAQGVEHADGVAQRKQHQLSPQQRHAVGQQKRQQRGVGQSAGGGVNAWAAPAFGGAADEALLGRNDQGEGQEEEEGSDDSEEEAGAIAGQPDGAAFTFAVAPGLQLRVTPHDVDFVKRLVSTTRLATRLPEEVLAAARAAGCAGARMTRAEFNRCVRELVPAEWLRPADTAQLSQALNVIFYAYDPSNSGSVARADALCGLSLLCSGSKSSKLSFTYGLFDESGKGLGPRKLRAFVRSLVALLCACVMREAGREQTAAVVDQAADYAIACVFSDALSPCRGLMAVTFDQFGQFYNEYGFQKLAYLELLHLAKWVPGVDALEAQALTPTAEAGAEDAADADTDGDDDDDNDMVELGGGGASERADAEEDEAGGGVSAAARAAGASAQPAPRFYFQISESSAATPLSIEEDDARAVMELVDRTGLARAEPQRICGALLRAADAEGALSKRAFDQCMQVLALGAQLKAQERTRCAVLLSSIYYAFDRGNDGRVDALELATGFSILCGGNKSSKLVYAWDLLADADGALTRRGLWRYMRSFLTVLMALSSASGTLTAKELTRAVDDSAVWVSARVFADLRAADAATRITFTDLADWYTEGLERSAAPGFTTSPWLELLDMSKWGAALGGA